MNETVGAWFCVGGGPSLAGFDWERLRGRNVIAINRALEVLPFAQVVYFTDFRFFGWHKDKILAHAGRKICTAKHVNHPDIETWKLTGLQEFEMVAGGLRSGNNSGYAALNLAVQFLAKQELPRKVVLLGYDMKLNEAHTHWHNGHSVATRSHVFAKMMPWFNSTLPQLKSLGVQVVNANPDSALDTFQKMSIDEAMFWADD